MHMLHDKGPKDFELHSLVFKIVTLDFEDDKTDGIPEVDLTVVDTRDLWQLPPGTCWSAVRRSYHMIASDLFDSHDRGFYTAKGVPFQNLPRMNFVHGSSSGKAKMTVRRPVIRWDPKAEEYKEMTRTFRVSADSDGEVLIVVALPKQSNRALLSFKKPLRPMRLRLLVCCLRQ